MRSSPHVGVPPGLHRRRRHRGRDHDRAAPRARRRVPGTQRYRERRRRRIRARHGHVEPDERGEERQHRRAVRLRCERCRQGGDGEEPDLREVPEGDAPSGLPQDVRDAEGLRRGRRGHTRSQSRRDRDGGHAAWQARLRAEAADAHGQRGPGADRGRAEIQRRDADGQPGPLGGRPPTDAGMGGRRRDWRHPRRPLLDQSSGLAAGFPPADRNARGSRRSRLGSVDWSGSDATVQP